MVKPEKTTKQAPALAQSTIQMIIRQHSKLKPAQKIIFNLMMDKVQWDKPGYPVYQCRRNLIKMSGVTAPTYKKACEHLKGLGLIHWQGVKHDDRYKGSHRDTVSQRWASNQYYINAKGLAEFLNVMIYDLYQGNEADLKDKIYGNHGKKFSVTMERNLPCSRKETLHDHGKKLAVTMERNFQHKPEVLKPEYNKPEVLKPEVDNANTNTREFTRESNAGYNAAVKGRKRLEFDRAKAQTRQQQRQQQRQHQPETRVVTAPRSGRQVTQTRQPNGDWI